MLEVEREVERESRAIWHPMGLRRPGLRKHSVAMFLGSMVLLLLTFPFLSMLPNGEIAESLAISLVLLSAVPAVGAHKRTLAVAILLVVPALVARWMNHTHPGLVHPAIFLLMGMAFMGFVVVNLLNFIIRAPRVNSEVLSAGIGVYLLLGLFWSLAYTLVASLNPEAFLIQASSVTSDKLPKMHGDTAIYYSFITLNTVGYGDIVPLSGPARMLAVVQSTTGLFYMTLLIARLVSLYTTGTPVPVHVATHSVAAHAPGKTPEN